VAEEGIDAFRPCEILECDWQEDITTGIEFAKDLARQGLSDVIIPPSSKDSKQWVMEVLLCAEEARELVILAGLTPINMECEPRPDDCQNADCVENLEQVKLRHEKIRRLPDVAAKLLDYRHWIETQLCVENGADGIVNSRGETEKAMQARLGRSSETDHDEASNVAGDCDVPAWLAAAGSSPDTTVNMCESWEDEAIARASGTPQMEDCRWEDICETIRVLAAGQGLDGRPLIELQHACQGFGIPPKPCAVGLVGPAHVVVTAVADAAKAQICRRLVYSVEQRSVTDDKANTNEFLLLKACFVVVPSYRGLRFTDRVCCVCQSGQSTQGGRTTLTLAAVIGA
jgi:hypothetical protein